MNIDEFTDKELQVIQLIVPDMAPADACSKVLRDWYQSNLARMPAQLKTDDQLADDVIQAQDAKVNPPTGILKTP